MSVEAFGGILHSDSYGFYTALEFFGLLHGCELAHDVALPGFEANPWRFMKAASAFVLPSRWEGWPSALTEAMALGRPVVATRCPGGAREMIEHGVNGLLVPQDDSAALSAALLRLLGDSDLARTLASNARIAATQYDHRRVASRYADVAGGGLGG